MNKTMKINGKEIGEDCPIFLIAEAGVNHNGNMAIAKKLIDVAFEANVDAIKFQTFKTEELILKNTSKVNYQKETTDGDESFFDMLKKYELTDGEFEELKEYCETKNLVFLSTPFDIISVNFLESINIAAYKIGSGDMNNLPLLKFISEKKKPILLSTGMSSMQEIREVVDFLKTKKVDDIVLFQCTTNYPTPLEDVNLNVIDTLKEVFPDLIIGFSDHSLGINASIGAAAKGVKVIEKHFTLDNQMEGPDHKASLNPEKLKKWVKSIRDLELALGTDEKIPCEVELEIANVARKSIVSLKNIDKGAHLTEKNIGIKRPGTGLAPKFFFDIIGKKAKNSIKKDTLLNLEDIE